jgi:hypothetical protein
MRKLAQIAQEDQDEDQTSNELNSQIELTSVVRLLSEEPESSTIETELQAQLHSQLETRFVTDSRPIYPNRIEMVYNRYLARKQDYLAAHPQVKESQYRRVAGLKTWDMYSRRYLKETNLKFRQRLDINTKTLIEGSPNWTNEELDAFLDFQEDEDQRVEEEENERYIRMSGRNTEIGIRGIQRQIAEQQKRDEETYCFVY